MIPTVRPLLTTLLARCGCLVSFTFIPHVCAQVYDREANYPNIYTGGRYNEFIVSATQWNRILPHTIEAFYYRCVRNSPPSRTSSKILNIRENFLKAYRLPSWKVPLLCLDTTKWGGTGPFKLIQG